MATVEKQSATHSNKEEREVLLEVENLKKWFPVTQQTVFFEQTVGFIKAVNGVSFKLYKGETLGLVGESGCGKSTVAKLIMGLENPTEGEIRYRDITFKNTKGIDRYVYQKNVQMIFQDPFSSLNPRMKIYDILEEPYIINQEYAEEYDFPGLSLDEEEIKNRILKLLNVVGLESYHGLRYPHEFSGGQRQRIGIARSLAMSPEIIVADEPVSALDVSIQAQILNLMKQIQNRFNLTYLFIAHDLSVVKHVSDRIAVMYLGKFMEVTTKKSLYDSPAHPYTISLLSAIPRVDEEERKDRIILEGDVPSPINPPSGCVFSSRCYKAQPECSEIIPELREIEEDHFVACLFPEIGDGKYNSDKL